MKAKVKIVGGGGTANGNAGLIFGPVATPGSRKSLLRSGVYSVRG